MKSAPHEPSVRTYLAVFLALLALTAITVGVAFVDLGIFNNAVALLIATGKAGLVALFFMHVRGGPVLVKLTIAAGLIWNGILLGATLSDVIARQW